MAEKIGIEFDSPKKKYFPGDSVRLLVQIVNKNAQKIQCISVRFLGHCRAEWHEHQTKGNRVSYMGRQEFFRTYVNLVGEPQGPEFELSEGTHEYKAVFQLPEKLPSSFKSPEAYINYETRVKIQTSSDSEQSYEEKFYVLNPVDLSQIPDVQNPVKVINSTHYHHGILLLRTGNVFVELSLPRSGFMPPYVIPFRVDVENKSQKDIEQVRVKLTLQLKLKSTTSPWKQEKLDRIKIIEMDFPGVPKQEKKFYEGELEAPKGFLPANTFYSEVIESEYFVEAKIDQSMFKTQTKVYLSFKGPEVKEKA